MHNGEDDEHHCHDQGPPRDDDQAAEDPLGGPSRKAVKRGNACLPCRRRRIRCPAERPICATCVRLKKACVYDDGRTTGRIAKLKDRIAQLEQQVQNPASPTLVPTMADLTNSSVPAVHGNEPFVGVTGGYRNMSTTSGATGAGPLQPASFLDYDFGILDQTMMTLANTMSATDFTMDAFLQSPDDSSETALVGGWFDPGDVPIAVRDHLLDLFFCQDGVFKVTIHMPRFYARLALPPAKRPHPALLYAMYLRGARRSSQLNLRRLQTQFLEIAEKQIKVGLIDSPRLVDVLRAISLVTVHYVLEEQYGLAYHMAGSAIRLAVACGLHRIPTSVFHQQPARNHILDFTLRSGGYHLDPPEDSVELGERIYAFWTVYELDVCTAIAFLWDPHFDPTTITTPLPRPMNEYILGLVRPTDDIRLDATLDPVFPPTPSSDSFLVLRLKAVTLLEQTIRLRELEPKSLHKAHSHPVEFMRMKKALDYFSDRLPYEYRAPWWRWDEDDASGQLSLARPAGLIHLLLGNAYLELWNDRLLQAENIRAVSIARRMAKLIHIFSHDGMANGYGAFILCVWNEVAMTLLRETKRLQVAGSVLQAAVIDVDLDVVTNALKTWSTITSNADMEKADIAAMNTQIMDRLRASSQEEWAQAFTESRRAR